MVKRQKGQGLVEFSLIAPVLLLTILAIIETALIFQGHLTVQHAAREAARWAVTYKPERGKDLDGNPCDGIQCDINESEQEYLERRVALIKDTALKKAVGLRISQEHLGLDQNDFAKNSSEPNFYGVEIWGFPSFVEPDDGWADEDLRDHPGLPGLPIRVRVTHNVELLDPLFAAIIPRVRVVGQAEMINEGAQVGLSTQGIPALPPAPPLPPPDWEIEITRTPEPGDVSPTPTGTLEAGSTVTPTLTPTPTSTPTATPTGPFITLSNYEVMPAQVVLIDVNQHPPEYNPYELLWVDSSGIEADVILPSLEVDPDGFKRDIVFTIPEDSQGTFFVETRRLGQQIAKSAAVKVVPPLPDLVVRSIGLSEEIPPNEEITVTVEVENRTAGFVSGFFDVDLYVDPDHPPVTNRPGTSKQWMLGIGPLETKVITHVVTLYGGGSHELWAQVDTSDWVPDELVETNNIFGPFSIVAAAGECADPNGRVLSDRFAGPELDPKWRSALIGDATVLETSINARDRTLSIETNGSSLWDSPDGGAAFLYQEVTGDFVATLKIVQGVTGGAEHPGPKWRKIGLMARPNTVPTSPWVTVMQTRDGVQFGFRTGSRAERFANDTAAGAPVWVRLVRSGDTFSGYYSTDGSSWVPGTGNGENGGVAVDMDDTIRIGIAASSSSGTPGVAIVDDFEVCFLSSGSETCQGYSDDFEADSPIVWSDSDIGLTIPGSSSRDGGTMTVFGDGGSLWASDDFHYTYQQVNGDFVASLKINSGPAQAEWSKAGLMVRGSTAHDSAQVMVMKTRDHGVQFGYRDTDGDSNARFASDTGSAALPVWVRIARSGNAFSGFYSTDGTNWTYGGSATADLPGQVLIGMAVSSNSGSELGSGNFDDFLFCSGAAGAIEPPIIPPEDRPPGLKECVQTIELGSFEASVITPPWQRNVDAFHASDRKHTGNFSLEFRAKVGPRPEYKHLNPWAYQVVQVPGDVLPETTGTLSYWQLVVPDSEGGGTDPDDHLYLAVRDSSGVTETADIPLAHGFDATADFQRKIVEVRPYLAGDGFAKFDGGEIQLRFYGVHDGQPPGTSFYIDDVRFDICTTQPIPPDIPGTASIGGLVEVLLNARPTKMSGIQVWAFAPGGALYSTKTIHDSTYHFYNVPSGTYTIYAEVWMDSILYTATVEVELDADERNYAVNLLLQ